MPLFFLQMPLNKSNYKLRPHEYLKVVKILNYTARAAKDKFVNYFIKKAPALERIVIDTSKHNKTCRSDEEPEAEDPTRTHALEHLKTKIPSTIRFICL